MPMLHKYVHIYFSRIFFFEEPKKKILISYQPHIKTTKINHGKTRSSLFVLFLICAPLPVQHFIQDIF